MTETKKAPRIHLCHKTTTFPSFATDDDCRACQLYGKDYDRKAYTNCRGVEIKPAR